MQLKHLVLLLVSIALVDQTQKMEIYPVEINASINNITVFRVNSFNIDFLTMPLKFRPTQKGIPSQLNTTLNGSVYFGYRTDKYMISYAKNPFNKSDRVINHYGFSIGLFSGLGNTAMNSTTTNTGYIKQSHGLD